MLKQILIDGTIEWRLISFLDGPLRWCKNVLLRGNMQLVIA